MQFEPQPFTSLYRSVECPLVGRMKTLQDMFRFSAQKAYNVLGPQKGSQALSLQAGLVGGTS